MKMLLPSCYAQDICSQKQSELPLLVSPLRLAEKLTRAIKRSYPLCFYATGARRRSYSQSDLESETSVLSVEEDGKRYLVCAQINLLNHGLSHLDTSHASFFLPEVIQRGIILHVSCWVLPSLIQPHRSLSSGHSQTALLASAGERVPMLQVVWGRSMDQAPPEIQQTSSAQVTGEKGDQTPQWDPGAQMSFSFNYWRGLFVLY